MTVFKEPMGQCCLRCVYNQYVVCHHLQMPCNSVLAEREGLSVMEKEYEEQMV